MRPADTCRRGTAITDPSANPLKTRPPGSRPRALDGEAPEARRFSPLNAPQRAAVEAFCDEAMPWARRQARRTYGHLPDDMRQQAVDRAMRELRVGAHSAIDRRSLYAALAGELTEQLRAVHAGWCVNAAQAQWRKEGPVDEAGASTAAVASFVDDGLAGLERAVLQMELGAGRDTRTSRAALRLGPRQYARHRSEGLSKLRSAIGGHTRGRVCEEHADAVVLAATGDAEALRSLSSGPGRCRACAREAAGMRRVLQERLAAAPWPLLIKPAGVVAAKLGFAGALFGGKSAGGLGALAAGPVGTPTGAVAGVLAAAVVATGTAAIADDSDAPKIQRPRATTAAMPAPSPTAAPVRQATNPAPSRTTATAEKPRTTAGRRSARAQQRSAAAQPAGGPAATAPAPASQDSAPQQQAPSATPRPTVEETVGTALGQVRKDVVDPVTTAAPPVVQQPADQVLDSVEGTLDEVTGTVDGLLP